MYIVRVFCGGYFLYLYYSCGDIWSWWVCDYYLGWFYEFECFLILCELDD